MSERGFGSITISNLQDGSQIWTTTVAPVSPNYTFTISNLIGDGDANIKEGDMIFYSTNRYTVTSVSGTTVLAGLTQSLKGDTGSRGATWYSGTAITGTSTTPASYATGITSAIVGDQYLNTSTQNIYVCTTGGNASTAKWKYQDNIKGETGKGITSITPQYYLSTSSTQEQGGSWSNGVPDYVDGRYYWTRTYIVWSDGTTTTSTAIYDGGLTFANENAHEAMLNSSRSLGMKLNYESFSSSSSGEMYLHGYTDGIAADVDGYIMWNGVMRTVAKGMINPNAIVPFNRYIYIVLRLTSTSSTSGTKYMVWYNSGWKYAVTPTPSQVGGTWTWDEARDIVLGQFIEPGNEQDVVEAYLYDPPRNASQVQTSTPSPYQYSQSAVDWYNSNGGKVVNALTMLDAWADGAYSATTEINGGFIKTHTIQSQHLATDAIMSNNYQASDNISSPFSVTGTFLDLTNGNLYTPNFGIDNVHGTAFLNGEIIATSGRIGDSAATNYWEIGTKTDYNSDTSAALIGHGTSYIQVGDFQLSNSLFDTRMYDSNNQITYLYSGSTFWDFGVQVPQLNSSASGYVSGIDDNWLYIRNHENTIPLLKTDWNYLFRVDKSGMVYINGQSLDDRYALKNSSSEYVVKNPSDGGNQTINGPLTVTGAISGTATKATQLTHTLTINGTAWDGSTNTVIGTLGVGYGGTGATSFTSGAALIGNGSGAIQTRGIRNNTTQGALGWTAVGTDNTLITTNTLAYWDGRYNTLNNNSNIEYVKLGKLGTVVTHNVDEFITTAGGIVDGTLQVTDLHAGNLIVTGAARFTNGLFGDLTGTATNVSNQLKIQLNGGTTEGTSQFTFDGSAAKTVNITKAGIGLGNVENTALSTWAGSANLTTTKVGTLAGAAVKAVDTSISVSSTSVNLPTSAAVAAFVEGKGYLTAAGVTSVAESTSNGKISVTTNGTTVDVAVHGLGSWAYKSSGTASDVGLGNVTNNRQVVGLSSGTTSGHFVTWGTNGYTVTDSGLGKADLIKNVQISGAKLTLTKADGTTVESDVTITASTASGATVLTDASGKNITAGDSSHPVYFSSGVPVQGNVIPSITLNGSGNTAPSFYAPVAVGTNGQVLTSSGTGEPTWTNQSALSVGSATSATQFSSNRSITLTGDTAGTASANGSSGWSITTTTKTISSLGRVTSANIDNSTQRSKVTFSLASSSMTESKPPAGDGYILTYGWDNSGWAAQTYVQHTKTPSMMFRGAASGTDGASDWGDWIYVLSSSNYTDYTVKKDGTGATGTWGINVTGTVNGHTVNADVPSGAKFTDTTSLTSMTGVLPVANGGTGQSSGVNAANYFLNQLTTGSSTPTDNDYYISQYAGGGTTTTTYHRRPVSALWTYIKDKTDGLYVTITGAQTVSGAKTFSAATAFTNTTASTSKTTGAVKVSGGVGVSGAIHGQTLHVDDKVSLEFDSSLSCLNFVFN